MAGKIKKIVISDFHIGDGQEEGELNPWENFHHDEKLAELLNYYSSDYYEDEDLELIINGDFFDLLQIRYDGGFPVEITERVAMAKLKAALDGHPVVVKGLQDFISTPLKTITVLPGSHDFELIYPGCQRMFCERVCGSPTDDRFQFIVDRDYYEFDGIQVRHGMQFEAINRYDFKRMLIPNRKTGEPFLRQPYGSIFILEVLNLMKERRPYIDRVQPFSMYLLGAMFFDTGVALRLIYLAAVTFWRYRILPFFERARQVHFNLGDTFETFMEYSAFPNFERKVMKLMRRNPHVHTLIMGHTHLRKVRRFGRNRTYINTGTWTDLISLDIANLGMNRELPYATVEYYEDQPPRAQLRDWRGYNDLWRDIVY